MHSRLFFLWLSVHQSIASTNCETPSSPAKEGDCVPLSQLYEISGGKWSASGQWNSRTNWFGTNLCSHNVSENWYGVLCDENETVHTLDLSENGLLHSLPTAVGLLANLKGRFDLRSNSLTSQIPSQIGLLTDLVELDLSENSFSGTIPSQVLELCAKLNCRSSGSCSLDGERIPISAPTTFMQLPTISPTQSNISNASSVASPEPNDSVLVAAFMGVGLIVAGTITLCILRAMREAKSSGSLGRDHDGYFPFDDVPGSRNGLGFRKELDWDTNSLKGAELSSHEGNDRDSVILPGAFGLDLKSYLIQLEDLNLEQKPFAKGGNGQVYRGVYSGTAVAAKATFYRTYGDDRRRFDREFRVLASLHHPNIVTFFGMVRDRERGALYNVQELCTGGDLGQFLARHPPPYPPGSAAAQRAAAAQQAARSTRNGAKVHSNDHSDSHDQEVYTPETLAGFAEGLLAGVNYMHKNGFAHRDLKPENVLLTSDGHIKICDMGLAKGSKNSTTTGAVGTVVYMAPEVFGGEADVDVEEGEDNDEWVPLPAQEDDPNADGANDLESKGAKMAEGNNKRNDPRASDVYALGIMLWQLWHREVPFYGLTHLKIMRRILDGRRPISSALSIGDHTSHEDSAEGMQPSLTSSPLPRGSVENGLPEWPPPLAQLVSNAWAQHPSERPTANSLAKQFATQVRPLLLAAGDDWADVKAADSSDLQSLEQGRENSSED